jgi:hypothetical protein
MLTRTIYRNFTAEVHVEFYNIILSSLAFLEFHFIVKIFYDYVLKLFTIGV